MIGLIAVKEFRNNVVTPGFAVGLVLCLLLIPYTVYTGIQSYENRLARYETDLKTAENVYRKSHVYAQVNPLVVKPVSPLGIFCRGIAEQTGSKVQLDRKEKRVFSSDIVLLNENPFTGNFLPLDFTTALAILLSLLGILFSYDMLSREREDGTLKLALSNSLSRSAFFAGKMAGIFLTLLPTLLICFLSVFLLLQFAPAVRFTPSDYGRLIFLLLAGLVYFAFFVFLGGFISSRSRTSTASIIVNLFIWCFLLFLLPNAATYTGRNLAPVEDYRQMTFYLLQIDKTIHEQGKEIVETLKRENLELTGHFYCAGSDWDGGYLILFTPRSCMEYERRKKELMNPILLDNCDKKWAVQSAYLQQVYRQEKTVRYLSCLSPAGIFKQLAALLCRTGMDDEVSFTDQVRQFQDMFYGYFRQHGIFGSYAYFAIQKEEQFPKDWNEASEQASKWEKEVKRASTFDFSSFEYLNTDDLPRFAYVPPALGKALYGHIYLIAGILLMCVLLFWCAFVAFIRYDVR